MIKVCAHYCGTIIFLDQFETQKQADEFMKNKYILNHADEFESGEDDVIYPDEMFICDEDIPFAELPDVYEAIEYNELPF